MIKKQEKKIFINEFGIEYQIEMISFNKILIMADTGTKGDCYGYEFVCQNGKIDWDSQRENWALLPDDVIQEANYFAKYYHLIVFS